MLTTRKKSYSKDNTVFCPVTIILSKVPIQKVFNKDSEICCFLLHTRSNRVSMALCKDAAFVGGTFKASSENPAGVECVTIGQCTRELQGHLKLLKIRDDPGVDCGVSCDTARLLDTRSSPRYVTRPSASHKDISSITENRKLARALPLT